jgi:hypothetical protein
MIVREVIVDGLAKGQIYRRHGRWQWRRNSGAWETYSRTNDLPAVIRHIARVCLRSPEQVRLIEKEMTE